MKKVKTALCVMEQGVIGIPYSKVEVMADGPNGCRQITLSIGFTQFGGNLSKVISRYAEKRGKYSMELNGYVSQMKSVGLASNQTFINLLRVAGKEDPVMGEAQEEQFEKLYLGPALAWASVEGFKLALSDLVVCDSFLHSGSILGFLRNRFSEKTPKGGGKEEDWIRAYVKVRGAWLRGHSNKLLQNTVYRTIYMNELLANNDWDLVGYHLVALNGMRLPEIV